MSARLRELTTELGASLRNLADVFLDIPVVVDCQAVQGALCCSGLLLLSYRRRQQPRALAFFIGQ